MSDSRLTEEPFSLGNAEDILEAGLRLNDLNLFDSTTDILITGIHQERDMETNMIKVSTDDP